MLNIYITDLAAYNEGFLIGEWVSLPMCDDDLQAKIREILRNGNEACDEKLGTHEEIFITDYEFTTETKLFEVGEYSSVSDLNEKCEELEEYDEDDLKKNSLPYRPCRL